MWQQIKSLRLTRLTQQADQELVTVQRADSNYMLACNDLVDFARCPARWVSGSHEPPAKGYSLSDLVLEMLLASGEGHHRLMREPETYKTRMMVCPGCDSESLAKHCTRCNMDRNIRIVDKPWAARAKECVEWKERMEADGKFVIKATDWDRADEAVRAVGADADVAALLDGSVLNQTLAGDYVDDAGGEPIYLTQRVDVMPKEGHPLDCAIGLVYMTSDAAHGRQSDIAHARYYHMHAALALDMANHLYGGRFREVLQILVEPNPPYLVARRRLSAGFLDEGRRLNRETLAALTLCRMTGKYPTFDPSAPGTLHGWTKVEHDPAMHEGSDRADARFGTAAAAALQVASK